MPKLVMLLEQGMENANILTNIKKFLNSITVNEEGKTFISKCPFKTIKSYFQCNQSSLQRRVQKHSSYI